MKVLSRKMATTTMDDEDSEEERRRKAESDFAERQARAQKEREEKQKKYLEVRERLFGSSSAVTSGDDQSRSSSIAGNNDSGSRNSSRTGGKGRGRGKAATGGDVGLENDQSPARSNNSKKQLYDPGYSAKPNSAFLQRREGGSGASTPVEERSVLRAPRGPDANGKGFAGRGDRKQDTT